MPAERLLVWNNLDIANVLKGLTVSGCQMGQNSGVRQVLAVDSIVSP